MADGTHSETAVAVEIETLDLRLSGVAPGLMLHNGRLSDPLDPWTKKHNALLGVKPKSRGPEDWEALAHCEWNASLYLDNDDALDVNTMRLKDGASARIVFPGDPIRRAIVSGAKYRKQGKNVAPAVYITQPHFVLEYDGPKDIDKLYASGRFVRREKIQSHASSNYVTKPWFAEWQMLVTIDFIPSMVDRDTVVQAVVDAGMRVGIGNRRPEKYGLFGRFSVEVA